MANFLMAASLSLPKGSESYSKVSREIFHSCTEEKVSHWSLQPGGALYRPGVAHLEKPREHIGWLAPDDKEAGVEFPQVGIQVLQTLQEKPDEEKKELVRRRRRRKDLICLPS